MNIPWRYYQSGINGWEEITDVILPNPTTTPIEETLESTQQTIQLITGANITFIPEHYANTTPVNFDYIFISGSSISDKFRELCEKNTKIKIAGHAPSLTWCGRIIKVTTQSRPSGVHDYKDITITLQPEEDE